MHTDVEGPALKSNGLTFPKCIETWVEMIIILAAPWK